MAFEKTPGGSYGQKMPPFAKPLSKVINPVMTWRAKRSTGPAMGLDLLVLTTSGAKTGQRREAAWQRLSAETTALRAVIE